MTAHRLPFPLDDGTPAFLELPYLPISAADAERIASVAACLVIEADGE